jgi:hypothetical protein
MKKTLILACILMVFTASAQMICRLEDVRPNAVKETANLTEKLDVQYIQLIIENKRNGKNVGAFTGLLDIGANYNWHLMDETTQKPKIFNSPVHIFNYLHSHGWDFASIVQNTFSVFSDSKIETAFTYIFRRKK